MEAFFQPEDAHSLEAEAGLSGVLLAHCPLV